MGINLTGQTIASTYEDLVLISGSVLSNGTGSDITSLDITASNAVAADTAISASHALNADASLTAVSASHALVADSALAATSASYALSASHAENADTATSASYALSSSYSATTAPITTLYETVYAGENLTKTDPIYLSGSQGANPIAFKADAADAAKMPAVYIMNETISAGSTGQAIALGLIEGINLTGYDAGTEVYVAAGGGWTSTRPTGTSTVQALGIVTKGGNGGKGFVYNAGEFNLPNIASGYAWVGNGNSYPVAVTTSSIVVNNAISSSYASTALSASHALVADFALNADTGSALITASISDATVTFTKGDASTFDITVNNVVNADSASVAVSASHALNADNSISSSYASTALSSSYSDFALTASFAQNAQAFPYTGSAVITGSLAVTGSVSVNGDPTLHYRLNAQNGINACGGGSIANDNSNGGDGSLVGGQNNIIGATAQRGVIIGGNLNQLSGGPDSVSIGGRNTNASGLSVVVGGFGSTITGGRTQIFGCVDINLTGMNGSTNYLNMIGARDGFKQSGDLIILPQLVLGGSLNSGSADGPGNTIVGGVRNHITGSMSGSTLIGGVGNTLSHSRSAIIGGTGITSSADDTVYVPNLFVSGTLTAPGLTVDTGSLLITSSISDATITFTKGDASTYNLVVNNVENANSASVAVSASHALNADNAVSASYALTASSLEGGIPEGIWVAYTGSNNLFANTGSFNYTIAQGYATSSQIENSTFSAVNTQVGSARNSAIIGGTGHEMYDNTGGFGGVIVENSVILGGTSNGIFGDANNTFIVGGDNNQVEADDTNNSGIIGGNNNVAYAVDNTVVVGGSSNLLRSTSDNTIALGSTNNTLDFTAKTALINSHGNSNGTSNTNVTLISTDGASAFQDYNVYIGVNGAGGRTFTAGTSDRVKTYIDDLTVSGSVSASLFEGDGSGLFNLPAANAFPFTGSAEITGSLVVTGSLSGEVQTLSVSSNTASIDCATGNFFKLTIPGASTTQVVASNITPGQTINVLFEQESNNSGSITFPSYFKFAGGYDYEPTLQSGSKDIVSMVAFDATNLYTVSVKNLL